MKEPSILIVEDEGLIALHLREILEHAGYPVAGQFATGEAALRYLEKSGLPDLVFMDITLLGKMNGIETAREIRKNSEVPIIFLSARSNPGMIAEAEGITRSGFLRKPFDEADVVSLVELSLHL